jgi:hypothetical protein
LLSLVSVGHQGYFTVLPAIGLPESVEWGYFPGELGDIPAGPLTYFAGGRAASRTDWSPIADGLAMGAAADLAAHGDVTMDAVLAIAEQHRIELVRPVPTLA